MFETVCLPIIIKIYISGLGDESKSVQNHFRYDQLLLVLQLSRARALLLPNSGVPETPYKTFLFAVSVTPVEGAADLSIGLH